MKLRSSLLALVALVAIAGSAFSQSTDPNQRFIPNPITPPKPGPSVTNRVYTSAIITSPAGVPIGKVLTGSALVNGNLVQGLRLSASGLTPNAAYTLVIDGQLVGTGSSSAEGTLRMKFISPAHGRAQVLPASVLPIANAHSVALYLNADQSIAGSGSLTPNK